MSEIVETTAIAQSEETIRPQHSGELQNIRAAYRLNGKNYLKWSQLVRTVLKWKGKINHLMGTRPKLGDPHFEAWDEEDSMIMAWTFRMRSNKRTLRREMRPKYTRFKVKTVVAKQRDKTVTEYANQLKSLWQELDHYRVIKTKCPEDATILKDFIEQDRVYDFLVGLNLEFDQVRIQILGKQEVLCFNENEATPQEIDSLNQEEFETVMSLICNLDKPTSTGLLAYSGIGDVKISPSLMLKNVHHVPRLTTNLISIQKLTQDLHCNVVFYHSHCVFQDEDSGRMIGHAREWDRLYYLKAPSQSNITKGKSSHSFVSEVFSFNKEKVWFHHR
uniref:Retrotransposon gag domain-containing protein n=1 Tax=Vitis vinifera TaxID=29760 RepID=A5AGA9_VITVI|nr:hypothetical protein VITISV_043620 [Vitis vinifera]